MLPTILWILQKRIDGDDSLMELARLRLQQAKAGAEFYAQNPDEMMRLLRFRPWQEAPVVVHLPHDINMLDKDCHQLIINFATFASRENVYGLVLHDHHKLVGLFSDYKKALTKINTALNEIPNSPYLFIEYAALLSPHFYCEFMKSVQQLNRISACLDIGHLGIRQIYQNFRKLHKDIDVFSLTPMDKRLPSIIKDVKQATSGILPTITDVILSIGSLGKPVHFHLHDGHPLSTFSPFGFSDHISFFEEIPIPFFHNGKVSLPPMFGPKGLETIVTRALEVLPPGKLSFTLEIHPMPGYLHLNDVGHLFQHWKEKMNAEQMNYWLMLLLQHHAFLQKTIGNYLRTR